MDVELRKLVTYWIERVVTDCARSALVFDTECSALNGHVIQLGWVWVNSDGEEAHAESRLMRLPENVGIDPRAEAVHGITADVLAGHGEDPRLAMEAFATELRKARACGASVVAHNARFDCNRVAFTSSYWGVTVPLAVEDVVCTMRRAQMEFRGPSGRRKAPRNEELYHALCNESPTLRAHDALNDARITAVSYLRGAERGWW
jgi:DNA polymerase III epsilon subunit-like protein